MLRAYVEQTTASILNFEVHLHNYVAPATAVAELYSLLSLSTAVAAAPVKAKPSGGAKTNGMYNLPRIWQENKRYIIWYIICYIP